MESSPWGYYLRLGSALAAPDRVSYQKELASLQLPHLFVVLGASGREVARR